jgi:peptide/nickel transport system permease protein
MPMPVGETHLPRTVPWRLPLLFVVLLVVIALFAPFIAPLPPGGLPDNYDALKYWPPSSAHPFGTDGLGRVIHGSRISLTLAFSAVSLALLLGSCYGAVAGMLGGAVDRWLMRLLDVALSIPRLLLLLAVTAFWGALPLWALIVLLGTTGWFDVARLVRGEVQALAQRDFILAARATGIPRIRVLGRHLLPHLIPLLIVSATLNVASTIALEAGLSYLGLGVPLGTPSWGNIIREGAGVIGAQWWLTLFPGLAIIAAVVACHALGDALRDVFAMDQVHA